MLSATQITWNQAHYQWDDFKLGDNYTKYLLDTYGITVENGGRVIWNHVLNVIEVIITPPQVGGAYYPPQQPAKKKAARKKIKLIFIMGDTKNVMEKEIKKIVSPKIVSDIQNKLSEQLKTKISLKDVQIIKG